jgi:hypothetical protein
MRTNISGLYRRSFLLLAIFLQNGLLLQKFRHAQLAATTIGWDAGLATGEP